MTYVRGALLAEGKTKKVFAVEGDSTLGIFESKPDITWGDGAGKGQMVGKDVLATTMACNNFRLFSECAIPVAFTAQLDERSFVAPLCRPIPVEFVITRKVVAKSSFAARNPHIPAGTRLPRLQTDWFHKTKDKKWNDYDLPVDDAHMSGHFGGDVVHVYLPKDPVFTRQPFRTYRFTEVFGGKGKDLWKSFPAMEEIGRTLFLVHERAWALQGVEAVDLKIEFGLDAQGNLLVMDVVDQDSGRYRVGGAFQDKQRIRDTGNIEEAKPGYELLAKLSERHVLRRPLVALWTGSEKDDTQAFTRALAPYAGFCQVRKIICSAHKRPEQALQQLRAFENCASGLGVIIAHVGLSNGLGPILAANSTLPVVTVPVEEADVWSALRMPSDVPLMTILRPQNAVEAAMRILGVNHPGIYKVQQYALEERIT